MISAKSWRKSIVGGAGSGSWYRFDKKTTVEECRSLDVRKLYHEGLLKPGHRFTSSWSRAGREITSIGGVVLGSSRPERVVLLFRHRSGPSAEWEDVQELVELDWTPCNFGGERPWFLCPGTVNGVGCGRRVAVLHAAGKYFLCRHCYDLTYQSQRDNKMYRALHRAQNIREYLGGSPNMLQPFPEKPKGMHWSTYERLWWEHHEAEMEQLVCMREWLDKFEKKVG
jgi:hypothetical protein